MPVEAITELNFTNFEALGTFAQFERRQVDINLKWRNTDGSTGEHSSTEVLPAILSEMPNNVLKKHFLAMFEEVVRVRLGLAEWDDYR